jgi:tetratricopeptide (TPR) repeat protein
MGGLWGSIACSMAARLTVVLMGTVLLAGTGAPLQSAAERTGSISPLAPFLRQQGVRKSDLQWDARVEQWREAAAQHEPGKLDEAVNLISNWPKTEVLAVINEVRGLARLAVMQRPQPVARAQRLLGLTDAEARKGDANRTLKRGALLHTDIALLAPNPEPFVPGFTRPARGMLLVLDGRVVGWDDGAHWEFARLLLDSVDPWPGTDDMVRQWYLATSACLLNRRMFGHAVSHLEWAQRTFSSDAGILFYSGVMHEYFAAPRSQNATPLPGSRFGISSEESELRLSRQFLQQVVACDPQYAEAHLRLGRVTGLLGNHEEAVAELERAAATMTDPRLLYYAALFLGNEQAILGHLDAAREQFEFAAYLFPTSQSPVLALSQLANRAGDLAGALLALERAFKLPMKDGRHEDPWVDYHAAQLRNADELMAGMRKVFGGLPR